MDLCRCCYYKISIESSKDLLVENYDGVKFIDALNKITDIKVSENDEFPKKICHHCYEILLFICDFITLVKRTDNKFRKNINDESMNTSSVVDTNKSELNETNNDEEIDSEVDVFGDYYDVQNNKIADEQETSENIIVDDDDDANDDDDEEEEEEEEEENDDDDDDDDEDDDDRNVSTVARNSKDLCTIKSDSFKKEHRCPTCHKLFSIPYKLKRHMAVHNRPFKCNVCNKICLGATTFKEHTKMHKETSYKCKKCENVYRHKRSLQKHLYTIHKLATCNVCCELFDLAQIKEHLLSHKVITCQLCKKLIKTGKKFNKHLENHYKNGVFGCHICGKRFPRMYSLTRHLQSKTVHKT